MFIWLCDIIYVYAYVLHRPIDCLGQCNAVPNQQSQRQIKVKWKRKTVTETDASQRQSERYIYYMR